MKTDRHSMFSSARAVAVLLVMVFGIYWAGGVSSVRADQNKVNGMLYSKKAATYVGTEICAQCHDKEYKEYKLSSHYRIFIKSNKNGAEGCETCHGPGSIHVDAGGGIGVGIINPKRDPEICFTCHTDKKMQFRLPYHHPVLEGKMSCSDCHDPHGIDVKPWTATSEDGVNEVCFKCHTDKRGPFIWKHDALKDGCTTCHQVHGSVNDKMLKVNDYNLCLRCHAVVASPTFYGHAGGRWTEGTCWNAGCHPTVHGSNFNDHFRY